MNEALRLIPGGHPQTPSKSEFLCCWQAGKTGRGNGKKIWRRESLGMGERNSFVRQVGCILCQILSGDEMYLLVAWPET